MSVDITYCLKMKTLLVGDKTGPNKNIHCLEYGTSHSGYEIHIIFLVEQGRPESSVECCLAISFKCIVACVAFWSRRSFLTWLILWKWGDEAWGLCRLNACMYMDRPLLIQFVNTVLNCFCLSLSEEAGRENGSQQSAAVLLSLAFPCCDYVPGESREDERKMYSFLTTSRLVPSRWLWKVSALE